MQLGLFFTGISPGGGASSVWSLLLDGNINLSIVLTTIGTLESFSMYFLVALETHLLFFIIESYIYCYADII